MDVLQQSRVISAFQKDEFKIDVLQRLMQEITASLERQESKRTKDIIMGIAYAAGSGGGLGGSGATWNREVVNIPYNTPEEDFERAGRAALASLRERKDVWSFLVNPLTRENG